MSLDAKRIGARIRNLRVEKGLSQVALGKKIKVAGSVVSLWERGKVVPSLRTRVKLAKNLGIEIDLLSGDSSQNHAELREMAIAHSKKKLRTGKASAADVQAAIKSVASDAEKSAIAREEEIRQLMKDAHDRVTRKLSLLREQLGYDKSVLRKSDGAGSN